MRSFLSTKPVFVLLFLSVLLTHCRAGIHETKEWIIDLKAHRFLTALSTELGFADTEFAKGHAVAAISTAGCNFTILVVGPTETDAKRYATLLDEWRAGQGLPGNVGWSNENDCSAATYTYHPGGLWKTEAFVSLDLDTLRPVVASMEPTTQIAIVDPVWSKVQVGYPPDQTAANGARYWNLTTRQGRLGKVSGSIVLAPWMPIVLALWLLIPPVGVLGCFIAGSVIAGREAIPIARRRKLYGKIVLNGTYVTLGIHVVFVMATLPTRAFEPLQGFGLGRVSRWLRCPSSLCLYWRHWLRSLFR